MKNVFLLAFIFLVVIAQTAAGGYEIIDVLYEFALKTSKEIFFSKPINVSCLFSMNLKIT